MGAGAGRGICLYRFKSADPPRQLREYLNSPPDLEGNHLTAGRNLYIAFLQEAEAIAGLDFSEAVGHLRESISVIPELADAIHRNDLEKAAVCFDRLAEVEAEAYTKLSKIIGVTAVLTSG